MSRQSKAANKAVIAKAITKLHKNGEKGPSVTLAKHGKNPANRTYSVTKRPNTLQQPRV